MNTLRVLGKRGDDPITWDPANAEQVATAQREFYALRRKGFLAFDAPPGGEATEITDFDPDATEILFTRPVSGGEVR